MGATADRFLLRTAYSHSPYGDGDVPNAKLQPATKIKSMFISKPKGSTSIQHELLCKGQKGEFKNRLDRFIEGTGFTVILRTVALEVTI